MNIEHITASPLKIFKNQCTWVESSVPFLVVNEANSLASLLNLFANIPEILWAGSHYATDVNDCSLDSDRVRIFKHKYRDEENSQASEIEDDNDNYQRTLFFNSLLFSHVEMGTYEKIKQGGKEAMRISKKSTFSSCIPIIEMLEDDGFTSRAIVGANFSVMFKKLLVLMRKVSSSTDTMSTVSQLHQNLFSFTSQCIVSCIHCGENVREIERWIEYYLEVPADYCGEIVVDSTLVRNLMSIEIISRQGDFCN